ncbi:hypothetical protein GGF32_008088 [Allomyces javanicus]|nr:hypothetical protein GGF32_008088 [Allomyces javanicus]
MAIDQCDVDVLDKLLPLLTYLRNDDEYRHDPFIPRFSVPELFKRITLAPCAETLGNPTSSARMQHRAIPVPPLNLVVADSVFQNVGALTDLLHSKMWQSQDLVEALKEVLPVLFARLVKMSLADALATWLAVKNKTLVPIIRSTVDAIDWLVVVVCHPSIKLSAPPSPKVWSLLLDYAIGAKLTIHDTVSMLRCLEAISQGRVADLDVGDALWDDVRQAVMPKTLIRVSQVDAHLLESHYGHRYRLFSFACAVYGHGRDACQLMNTYGVSPFEFAQDWHWAMSHAVHSNNVDLLDYFLAANDDVASFVLPLLDLVRDGAAMSPAHDQISRDLLVCLPSARLLEYMIAGSIESGIDLARHENILLRKCRTHAMSRLVEVLLRDERIAAADDSVAARLGVVPRAGFRAIDQFWRAYDPLGGIPPMPEFPDYKSVALCG